MATTTGTEHYFGDLVTDLIYLEHDAIAAYDSTIERLNDPELAARVAEFRQDHLQHLETLRGIAASINADIPEGGDMKQMLTTGKIALADLMGDGAILKAMRTNEEDTVTAYDRARQHDDAIPASREFFEKALADEKRHRAWMEEASQRA
ncbi:ferritin-like domain-containing protein [Paracoccus sp. 1_MG-2023]|uniref:DUF892 family protein n=1 Tax=unclassified Paracoccus (in: a-proteobacteria) TaxID=2688777 RepID=UPI001C0A5B48|nr:MULTISPECIES: ferritin-like domain-containing protein [unclassified Paracoccus (in: a-proteobacteria)]MBU2958359.1 ferritin-like domain-containing protein [Paracoccus sp. C2R09]MDO6670279.1 ferritin-like domain-containing protein [Paracoccus sp. 1_MG-2023]